MDGAAWHPVIAYLYVLHLDGPSLAWEYLRRNPEYRRDWREHWRRPRQAQHWGLRLLENPDLDAREAHPDWCPDPPGVVLVHPDVDPPDGARPFRLWALPGEKRLLHDGRRLLLTHSLGANTLRLSLTPALEDGAPHVHGVHASGPHAPYWRRAGHALDLVAQLRVPERGTGFACNRPGRAALLHVRMLQTLDGVQAGASCRQIAEVQFGAGIVAECWHGDSHLRTRVRRLIARGRKLMRGGYRRLLHGP